MPLLKLCRGVKQCASVSFFSTIALNRTHNNFKPVLCDSSPVSNAVSVRHNVSSQKKLPIMYLFTKDGCTLCDEAVEQLRPYRHRFVLEKIDITLPGNEHWYDLYKYDIPVFHIYEEFLMKHRVDFEALEKGLEKYKNGFDGSLKS